MLYEDSQKRALEKYKFYAMLMGAEFKDDSSSKKAPRSSERSKPLSQSGIMFHNPSVYKNMTKQQKDELTRKMMGIHRQAMKKAPGMGRS